MNLPERRLLTVAEVGRLTGLSPNAVYRAIWDGELRASKLRGRLRVDLADVEAWIDANLVPAPGNYRQAPVPARRSGRSGPGRGLRELLKAE